MLQAVDGVLWRQSRLQAANGVQLSFMPRTNYVSIRSQGLINMHMSIQLLCVQTMSLHVARGNGKNIYIFLCVKVEKLVDFETTSEQTHFAELLEL